MKLPNCTSLVDRFLHHADRYQYVTYDGRIPSAPYISHLALLPGFRLGTALSIILGAFAYFFAPENALSVFQFGLLGTIIGTGLGKLFENAACRGKSSNVRDYWVDRKAQYETDLLALKKSKKLVEKYEDLNQFIVLIAGFNVPVLGATAWYAGYNGIGVVMCLSIISLLTQNVAIVERYQRVVDKRYTLFKPNDV